MAPIKTRWQWKLRFKSPLSPSRGIWDVTIETNSPDYDNARKVADAYLAQRMSSPSTRFVLLEPALAYSEDEMKAEMGMAGNAISPRGEVPQTSTVPPMQSGEASGAGAASGLGAAAVTANRQQRIGQ